MSKTNRWKLPPEIIFDPLVVVTAMTTLGSIVAILALVGSGGPSKKIVALCSIIAVIGLMTMIYQLRRLCRFDKARVVIGDLLAEGQELARTLISTHPSRRIEDYPSQTFEDLDEYMMMENWCKRVEDRLRPLGESYVTRFHLGGSLQQDERSMTIWKTRHRLETLASFLLELK